MTARQTALRAPLAAALLATAFAVAAAPAHAAVTPVVAGQTISLPLNEEPDGPMLKLAVKNADSSGNSIGPGFYVNAVAPNESRADRKARGDAVPQDSVNGRNLVKFIRFAADDLRVRSAGQASPRSVTVTASFRDTTRINQGSLWGDSLKAGFTFGLAAPATTAIFFASHIEVAVDTQTFTCDAEAPGRVSPRPRKDDPHANDALDKMAEDARKACWAQISDKVAAAAFGAAPAAAPGPAAPANAAPATPAAAPAPIAAATPVVPLS